MIPLVSPLDELGDRYLLSAHMLQHMLIGDAAPALILVAVRGPLLLFVIPTALLPTLGTFEAHLKKAANWLLRPRSRPHDLGHRVRDLAHPGRLRTPPPTSPSPT